MTDSSSTFPDLIEVPARRPVGGRLEVPPSKSITHRYLALALLSGRPCRIVRPLFAEDTYLFMEALRTCGWRVDEESEEVTLTPGGSPLPASDREIRCGNCGTMFRLLVGLCSALPGSFVLDGVARLRERPIAPLLAALRELGARIDELGHSGHAPVRIHGRSLVGGTTLLDAGDSSQFLSALLLAGLGAREPATIHVSALSSTPYIDLTLAAARLFGGRIEELTAEAGARRSFRVWPSPLAAREAWVEGDASSACYGAAAAALSGGTVRLAGIPRSSAQGDLRFLALLEAMGARVRWQGDELDVTRGQLRAIEADLSDLPDQVPTLAALAPFASGVTKIVNVAHLRLKESDRLQAMSMELRRLGAVVDEHPSGLEIPGVWAAAAPPSDRVVIDSHRDHRIAMSLALVGLRRPGVVISAPHVVAKSYPRFWTDLEQLIGS